MSLCLYGDKVFYVTEKEIWKTMSLQIHGVNLHLVLDSTCSYYIQIKTDRYIGDVQHKTLAALTDQHDQTRDGIYKDLLS
jgi:hypothetical protein